MVLKKWKILESQVALDSKWFRIVKEKVKLSDSTILDDYYVWNSPDVSLIIPVKNDGNIILVRQYKHGAKDYMIEFPAGVVDEDEDPFECAKRELMEETGYSFATIEKIGVLINNPTKQRGRTHIFLAKDCVKASEQDLDHSEDIEVLEANKEEVIDMAKDGRIWVSGSVAALFLILDKI